MWLSRASVLVSSVSDKGLKSQAPTSWRKIGSMSAIHFNGVSERQPITWWQVHHRAHESQYSRGRKRKRKRKNLCHLMVPGNPGTILSFSMKENERKLKNCWSLGSVKNKLKLYIIKNTKSWGENTLYMCIVDFLINYYALESDVFLFFSFWFSKVFSPRLSSSTEKLKDNRFLFSNQGQNEKIEDQDEKKCWK